MGFNSAFKVLKSFFKVKFRSVILGWERERSVQGAGGETRGEETARETQT